MDRSGYRRHQHRRITSSSYSSRVSSGYRETEGSGYVCTSRRNRRQVSENEYRGEGETDAPFIVGTCPYMCPERERCQRESLQDLAVFERLNGNPGNSSADLAVKKFSRTVSPREVQASDVRPLPVLEETLNHLLRLLDSRDQPFEVVHDFIFDRTRSIRQDLSMQNIASDKAIYMYEKMVKFHVISHHKLRHCSGPSTYSMHRLNMQQLMKALTSLYNLYDANKELNHICENEAEFRSLYVLLHLHPGSQPMGESLALWFRNLPSDLMKSKGVCFARKALRFFRMGNYKGFLCTTASEASYLQYCILEPYISEIRALALECINSVGYKLHPYPFLRLSKILMMKESDVESFCNACGLEKCTDNFGRKSLPTKQTTFCYPKFQQCALLGSPFERILADHSKV